MKHGPYTTATEILANASVSDDPRIMQLDMLPPQVLADIVAGRLHGYHPVSVRWPDGQFALMFCEPGTSMPGPQQVIDAFHQCLHTPKIFPEGALHE